MENSHVEKIRKFGDLYLTYTNNYSYCYDDDGSGAVLNGGFWHPIPPEHPDINFFALGSLGINLKNYNNLNGEALEHASLCVGIPKELSIENNEYLAYPREYKRIWSDTGSHGRKDGSCWKPLAPKGYNALGCVFVEGYNPPDINRIVCVKKGLTEEGVIGELIWQDKGSGADKDLAVYSVNPPQSNSFSLNLLIAANTFVGYGNCLLYTSPSPRDQRGSRMPSSA